LSATSRLESLSDGAFAVAIGLLVVTVADPRRYADLMDVVRNAPAVAGAFAVLLWIWSEHRRFFRRYALDDVPTVFLNGVLLFLVLFYVYPLKFVASYVIGTLFGLNPQSPVRLENSAEGSALLRVYGIGFVAIFGVFALLYRRAWKLREKLGLGPLARFDTRTSFRSCVISISVGVLSLALTTIPSGLATGLSGFSYVLLGPAMGFHGYASGRAREKLERAEAAT
jgi:hypothetical protein